MLDLTPYISLTTMIVLATIDEDWNPYTSNLYFAYDEAYNFYFISRPTREHSKHIEKNSQVAWSVINTEKYWANDSDKKWLQFQGACKLLEESEWKEIFKSVYNPRIWFEQWFPEGHRVYKCIPNQVKIHDESDKDLLGKVIIFN